MSELCHHNEYQDRCYDCKQEKEIERLTTENSKLERALSLAIENKERAELTATAAHQEVYYKALTEQSEAMEECERLSAENRKAFLTGYATGLADGLSSSWFSGDAQDDGRSSGEVAYDNYAASSRECQKDG